MKTEQSTQTKYELMNFKGFVDDPKSEDLSVEWSHKRDASNITSHFIIFIVRVDPEYCFLTGGWEVFFIVNRCKMD